MLARRWATSPTPSTRRRSRALPGHDRRSATSAIRRPARAGLANAQPILIDCAHGQIAICHNGNLVNAQRAARRARAAGVDLPDEQRHRGASCTSTRGRKARDAWRTRSSSRSSQVQGAFSLVLLTKDRLIAVRDPHGFRPLALGRLGDAYVVCSETCAMDLIGADLRARRRAGRGARHQRRRACGRSSRSRRRRSRTASSSTCTSRGPTATCSARASTRCGPSSAGILAREQPVDADVVVPVPDSGVCAAIGFRRGVGHPAADGPHPQPLRRPHVHPAAAVDPPLRRAR